MEHLSGDIWLQRGDAQGFPTVAAVVLTARRAVVVDTLTGPAAMEPARDFVRERAGGRDPLVVTTHHHWDHVYGNAAFGGGVEIVAHVACPGLMRAQAAGVGEPAPEPPPEGVPLPCVTFDSRLVYGDAGETIHLVHAPGHSQDSIVVYLEGAGVLFAGDALEWPLPSLGPGSEATTWLATIAELRALSPRVIVPSHGPVMDARLLDANERYLAGLRAAVAEARQAGACVDPASLPAERFLETGIEIPHLYGAVHAANLAFLAER